MGRFRVLENPDDPSLERQVAESVSLSDPREIVIELGWFSRRPEEKPLLRDVEAFFRDATLDYLRTRCFLSSSETGAVLAVSDYRGPDEGFPRALLSFPRFDADGVLYFTGSERTILLRIETETNFGVIEQSFSPRRMFFDGGFTI